MQTFSLIHYYIAVCATRFIIVIIIIYSLSFYRSASPGWDYRSSQNTHTHTQTQTGENTIRTYTYKSGGLTVAAERSGQTRRQCAVPGEVGGPRPLYILRIRYILIRTADTYRGRPSRRKSEWEHNDGGRTIAATAVAVHYVCATRAGSRVPSTSLTTRDIPRDSRHPVNDVWHFSGPCGRSVKGGAIRTENRLRFYVICDGPPTVVHKTCTVFWVRFHADRPKRVVRKNKTIRKSRIHYNTIRTERIRRNRVGRHQYTSKKKRNITS